LAKIVHEINTFVIPAQAGTQACIAALPSASIASQALRGSSNLASSDLPQSCTLAR
jgi:hypothetical protein